MAFSFDNDDDTVPYVRKGKEYYRRIRKKKADNQARETRVFMFRPKVEEWAGWRERKNYPNFLPNERFFSLSPFAVYRYCYDSAERSGAERRLIETVLYPLLLCRPPECRSGDVFCLSFSIRDSGSSAVCSTLDAPRTRPSSVACRTAGPTFHTNGFSFSSDIFHTVPFCFFFLSSRFLRRRRVASIVAALPEGACGSMGAMPRTIPRIF